MSCGSKTLPKPTKDDFVEIQWYEYKVGEKNRQVIDTVIERIHRELIDVFKTYVILNSFIDGIVVNKGVSSFEYAKRRIKDKTGKYQTQNVRTMSKREAIRKYAKKAKLTPIHVKNILISHDILVKAGHSKIVNNIYALFWNADYLLCATYAGTVQFLKDADMYDILNDDTKDGIDDNLKELEKYDNFKTIHHHKLRELEPSTRVNMPEYTFDEDNNNWVKTKDHAVQTVFTFKKIDDDKCLINDHEYLYTELTIVNRESEKQYKRRK